MDPGDFYSFYTSTTLFQINDQTRWEGHLIIPEVPSIHPPPPTCRRHMTAPAGQVISLTKCNGTRRSVAHLNVSYGF